MAKKKETKKGVVITYTKPKLNKNSKKYEILKMNSDNDVLDTISCENQTQAGIVFKALVATTAQGSELNGENLDPNPMSNKDLRLHRINTVLNFRLLGYEPLEIYNLVNNGGPDGTDEQMMWDISYSTIKRYYKAAHEVLYEDVEKEKKDIVLEAKRRWNVLMRAGMKQGDLTNAREAAKQLDKIEGLDRVTVDMNVKSDDVSKLSDEELLEKLKQLTDGNKGE